MSQYFARSMMDLNSSSSHIGVPRLDLKKTLSHNDLSPRTFFTTGSKSDILSPRYFEDTPAPNSYQMKTSIGLSPGVSFKGDRKRNFDSARKEACFLLPNLVDETPGPNAYNVEEHFGFGGSRASMKGRRLSGPFQTNRGQMHIAPQVDDRSSRFLSPSSYDIPSSIKTTSGVSMKGDRTRNFNETPRMNCGFLLPRTIEATPGPGSYNVGTTIRAPPTATSFKGSRSSLGPFQSESGKTYISPELSARSRNDTLYDVPTVMGKAPGVSMKGNRGRKFDSAKAQNALFLVPEMIDLTPAPGAYDIKTTIGMDSAVSFKGSRAESRAHTKQKSRQRTFVEMNPPGVSFKGDRTRRFDHLKENHATFLLPGESNDAPAPGSYNIKTTVGSGYNGLKENRVREHYGGPFQGNSGPMYIKPEINTRDKTPGPNDYRINSSTLNSSPAVSFKGRRLRSLFGEPVRPGPADYSLTKANLRKTPMFSNRQKTKPSYPESLNYTAKDSNELPGPGSYSTRKKFSTNDSPAYKIGEKLKEKINENPAPNKYEYEKHKSEGPSFSMGKRFELPENRTSPGPASYTPKDQAGAPKYSLAGRAHDSKVGEGPGPNAYTLNHDDDRPDAGTSFKSRASPFVYSGFQTNKFMENSNPSVVATQS